MLPFPVLGLDTDNGGEFINAEVLAYCEREHITFTRKRVSDCMTGVVGPDMFKGFWEQITSWLIANPERTGVLLFQLLQDLYLGRFRDT